MTPDDRELSRRPCGDNPWEHAEAPHVFFHELAHQWFGNHVSVARWRDIWLGEGLVTYAGWLWDEHRGEATVSDLAGFEHNQQQALGLPPPADPPPNHLFNRSVYGRGALTLHALRLQIGDDAFFRTLRTWVDRYGGGATSTEEFIALAEGGLGIGPVRLVRRLAVRRHDA